MDTPRPTSDLAADVRAALDLLWGIDYEEESRVDRAVKLLENAPARVTDLEAQVAAERKVWAGDTARAEAAEAQVAALTQERDESGGKYLRAVEETTEVRVALADTRKALATFVENWDFHACDYLVGEFDEEMRAIPARVVDDIIEAQKVARRALAAEGPA